MRQDAKGVNLILVIHPDEVPEELFRSFVGSRYQIAMVGIDDNEEPKPRQLEHKPVMALRDGNDLARYAGQLCREQQFQEWLLRHISYAVEYPAESTPEEVAAIMLRRDLGVLSRKDISSNRKAEERFERLVQQYLKETSEG